MIEPFAKTWIYRDWVESTNDLAKELVAQPGSILPIVVWTKRQTRGRGRGEHVWWSDGGSLTFTVGLDPSALGLERRHEPRIALASAVAVIDTLARFQLLQDLVIRWPNDIEASGRKLSGLLPERVETKHGPRIVVGFGINVHSRLDDAPQAVRNMAVSVAELAQAKIPSISAEDWIEPILENLARTLHDLSRDGPALAARWNELDALKNQPLRIDLGPRIISGEGRGIDDDGALLVASEGRIHRLFGGQVLRGNG